MSLHYGGTRAQDLVERPRPLVVILRDGSVSVSVRPLKRSTFIGDLDYAASFRPFGLRATMCRWSARRGWRGARGVCGGSSIASAIVTLVGTNFFARLLVAHLPGARLLSLGVIIIAFSHTCSISTAAVALGGPQAAGSRRLNFLGARLSFSRCECSSISARAPRHSADPRSKR